MKFRYFFFSILFFLLLCLPLIALAAPSKPTLEQRIIQLETKVAELQALLANVSRFQDSNGYDTLQFKAMNVQIVNGKDMTDSTNGTGNLIIGYNEVRVLRPGKTCDSTPEDCNRRYGSHNLVIGIFDNYSAYGGMVVGNKNEISGQWASVSGGIDNRASGDISWVSGGYQNTASGFVSSVSGGTLNEASGRLSSVSGGLANEASGQLSSVSGGHLNTADGEESSVSGGNEKTATGVWCWEGDTTEDC